MRPRRGSRSWPPRRTCGTTTRRRPTMMEDAVAEVRADFAEQRIPSRSSTAPRSTSASSGRSRPSDLRRLTIAQTGRYLLLEFPYRRWPLALEPSVKRLVGLGVTPAARPSGAQSGGAGPPRPRARARRGRRARPGHRRLARRSPRPRRAGCGAPPARPRPRARPRQRLARPAHPPRRAAARSPAASGTRRWRAI